MAESADKTPAKGAKLEEESDVVELTDEVGATAASPVEDIPEPETLDSMGLKMPAFKMPGEKGRAEAKPDGDDQGAELEEEPETQEMSQDAFQDVMADETPDGSDHEGRADEDPSETDGDAPAYDRQAMVKTIQMDAFDREELTESAPSELEGVEKLLEGPRFSPGIIVAPPRVLVKKWREGLPGDVELIVSPAQKIDDEPKPLSKAPVASRETEQDDEVDAIDDDVDVIDDEVDAIDDDVDVIDDDVDVIDDDVDVIDDDVDVIDDDVDGEEPAEIEVQGESGEAETLPELPSDSVTPASVAASASESQTQEPIELDDDLVELEEDDVQEAKGAPPPHRVKDAEAVSSPKEQPVEAKPQDVDDEMKGLVQELMEEEKQQRKKRRGKLRPRDIWFKKVFSEEYLRTVPSNIAELTHGDADFIETSLRLKKKSRILDLACGYGRHSLELARRGYEMVGLDLSKPLLRHALEGAKKNSLNTKFIHGDMRKLGFSGMFDGCFIWDTSLGYFDDRTNLAVLQGVSRALKVGGRLLVDVINRDYVVRDTPTRLWWEGNGCIFLEESEFDYQRSVLEVERSYIYEDGTPPQEHKSFIRLYNVHELRQMLHVAGFKVLEVSGAQHYKGHFLGSASQRIIVLAEKRKRRKSSAPGKKPKSK